MKRSIKNYTPVDRFSPIVLNKFEVLYFIYFNVAVNSSYLSQGHACST